jgi:hypothetical protein
MDNKNYKLYRIHQQEIFEMVCQVIDDAPLNPDVFGTATAEEKEKYNKDLNEYLDNQKPELIKKFIKMGFDINK